MLSYLKSSYISVTVWYNHCYNPTLYLLPFVFLNFVSINLFSRLLPKNFFLNQHFRLWLNQTCSTVFQLEQKQHFYLCQNEVDLFSDEAWFHLSWLWTHKICGCAVQKIPIFFSSIVIAPSKNSSMSRHFAKPFNWAHFLWTVCHSSAILKHFGKIH
jgi:hypothetical protein